MIFAIPMFLVSSEVFTAFVMKIIVFFDIMSC